MKRTAEERKAQIRANRDQRQRAALSGMVHKRFNPIPVFLLMIIGSLIGLMLLFTGCAPMPVRAQLPTEQPSHLHEEQVTLVPVVTDTPYPTRTPLPVCIVTTGYTEGTVNIRSGPGMQYSVIDIAKEGDELTIVSRVDGGWAQVCTRRLSEGYFLIERWCK